MPSPSVSDSDLNPMPQPSSHPLAQRQARRSRTRTRRSVNAHSHASSSSLPPQPRYSSEDHPLSEHKLAQRSYHSFTCLGVPFHVHQRYTYIRELGIGAYGCVALARDNILDCNVAIKKVTRVFERDVLARRALREVAVLRQLGSCDNATSLIDLDVSFIELGEIYLFLSASEADLSQIIRSGQSLSDAHLQYFVAQILRGVRYMHASNVLHRDLKPGNLLVNANCELRICDFGLARAHAGPSADRRNSVDASIATLSIESTDTEASSLDNEVESSEDSTNNATPASEHIPSAKVSPLTMTKLNFPGGPLTEYVATRWYRAPEIMLCFKEGYGVGSDMWSVGCILAELIEGKPLFAGKDYVDQIARINNVLGSPSDAIVERIGSERAKTFVKSLPPMPKVPFNNLLLNASPLAIDLLSKLLVWDPEQRLTADEALQHPWLKAYHETNSRWSPPSPFNKFAEVELIGSVAEFRSGLKREAQEIKDEMAELDEDEEAEERAAAEAEANVSDADAEADMGSHDAAADSGASINGGASSSSSCGASSRSRLNPISATTTSSLMTPSSPATSTDELEPVSPAELQHRGFEGGKLISASSSQRSAGRSLKSPSHDIERLFTTSHLARRPTYRRRAVSNAACLGLDDELHNDEDEDLQLLIGQRSPVSPATLNRYSKRLGGSEHVSDVADAAAQDRTSPHFRRHGTDLIVRPRAECMDRSLAEKRLLARRNSDSGLDRLVDSSGNTAFNVSVSRSQHFVNTVQQDRAAWTAALGKAGAQLGNIIVPSSAASDEPNRYSNGSTVIAQDDLEERMAAVAV